MSAGSPAAGSEGACCVTGSCRSDGRNEDVPRATHRFDDLRILGIDLQLLAKSSHLDIDGAVEWSGFASPRLLQQEIARQHAAGMAHEGDQKFKLARGQCNFSASGIDEAAG